MKPRHKASSAVRYWPAADSLWASDTARNSADMLPGWSTKTQGRGWRSAWLLSLAPCPTWAAPWGPLVAALGSRPHDFIPSLKSCSTLGDPMDGSTPGFPVHHHLPKLAHHKLMSTESVMPSNHRILCHPLRLLPSIFPSIRVFSNESALHIRRPKYWSFSFSISPSNEYSGLIPFRMDCWVSLRSKGLSRVFSNTTVQMTFRWMAFRWSSWSEDRGAPEMRGRLVEKGSCHSHLGTGPALAPWNPGPAVSTGPVETQPSKRCHYAPLRAEGLQFPPEVCLWERQGSEAKAESKEGKRK